MNFKQAAILGSFISKDYAEDLFRLLVAYTSISASEAASRLDLHVKTVQDVLESLTELKILEREEVYEKKRPYFRYRLAVRKIVFELDLNALFPAQETDGQTEPSIRERFNADARFTTSRDNQYISSVTIWTGQGRNRTERKINLSTPQGRFLFHLPFPGAPVLSVSEIMKQAGITQENRAEIIDIVEELISRDILETKSSEIEPLNNSTT